MEEKIQTLHPQGKKGVHINKAKYEAVKKVILDVLGEGRLTHDQLTHAVERKLKGRFEGSVAWYMESTKLDLEARGTIERVSGDKAQVYRVKR